MHAQYRNSVDSIISANESQNYPGEYIPRVLVKNPKYKKAMFEEVPKPPSKQSPPSKAPEEQPAIGFKLKRSNSFVPATLSNLSQEQSESNRASPKLIESDKTDSIHLELLQSRNPQSIKTLGVLKNASFSHQQQTKVQTKSNYDDLMSLFKPPVPEICNDASLKNQWAVSDWERINKKKLQRKTEEY
ncbi:Hypothetical_protein [Hexamita inflata]|uniref:Hypothetical_protein n=1 Tax=Hexamita inflata TaxID=28002 RepID=A0AA86PSX3_9EUKA|nr:Hypothetical protein HINF_LOCUS28027 [Hexamita inflata]